MYRVKNNFLIARARSKLYHLRHLYSETGEWPKYYDTKVREATEEYWKPKINELDSKIHIQGNVKNKEKFYVLSMFPYPSGKLHMGHVRVYAISDVMARFHRACGKHVIHPMGWDAFGLPAENAAIDRGKHPREWTVSNIESMKKQLEDFCYSFEYDRGFSTCDPEYYKWTQFIFTKMWEHGLVYQKMGAVNWDPVDETVLADEQIDEEGCSWRSGAKVERRFLKQWYIKTSAYAKSLWDGLDEVDSDLWHDVIDLQKHWIGKCDGVRFELQLLDKDRLLLDDHFSVFTKTPEGIYGASHILISPDHYLNQEKYYVPVPENYLEKSFFDPKSALDAFMPERKRKRSLEREVIPLNVVAQNHLKGNYIPIFVHKTWDFGEHLDSHIGMPCFSTEDYDFANAPERELRYTPTVDQYGLLKNSGKYSGMTCDEAAEGICEETRSFGKGGYPTSERSRDWCISRQRYWGTPIPMMHCPTSGTFPVPYEQLPVTLPEVDSFRGVGGKSPLASAGEDWLCVPCPKGRYCRCVGQTGSSACCGSAVRETDTMDTFVDSSWYFLRYLSPRFQGGPCDPNETFKNMPIDLYIGGKEHAIMHLYYARFFCHFLYNIGVLPQREPFKNLLTQGMVKGKTFRHEATGRYVPREEVDFSGHIPRDQSGNELVESWEKMSKSKYNGVDPQEVIAKYGTDTTRLCILGCVAPKSDRNWSDDLFHGISIWQGRIWKAVAAFREAQAAEKVDVDPEQVSYFNDLIFDSRNYFLKEVNFHLTQSFLVSTAVSRLQGLTSILRKVPTVYIPHLKGFERALNDLVVMVSVFAPMFGAELRSGLGKPPQVIDEWPVLDPEYRIKMQVRLERRQLFEVPVSTPLDRLESLTRSDALDLAMASPKWKEAFGDHPIDHVVLHVTPYHRVELFVVCSALIKEKKAKKKAKARQNRVEQHPSDKHV